MPRRKREDKEKHVLENLKEVVLSMLREQPMCGYDLIKAIYQRHDVVVSQGRVYPLLYSLEGRGVLRVELKGNTRTKLYLIEEQVETTSGQ